MAEAAVSLLAFAVVAAHLLRWILWFDGLGDNLGTYILAALTLGSVVAFGYRATTNYEWGSRLDLPQQRIVWWYGKQPAARKMIAIADIKSIVAVSTEDGTSLKLVGTQGQRIDFNENCVPEPRIKWAELLHERFPEVEVKRSLW